MKNNKFAWPKFAIATIFTIVFQSLVLLPNSAHSAAGDSIQVAAKVYIDAPWVQASYVSRLPGYTSTTEDFNTFSADMSIESIPTVPEIRTCTFAYSRIDNTNNSSPIITDGGNLISDYLVFGDDYLTNPIDISRIDSGLTIKIDTNGNIVLNDKTFNLLAVDMQTKEPDGSLTPIDRLLSNDDPSLCSANESLVTAGFYNFNGDDAFVVTYFKMHQFGDASNIFATFQAAIVKGASGFKIIRNYESISDATLTSAYASRNVPILGYVGGLDASAFFPAINTGSPVADENNFGNLSDQGSLSLAGHSYESSGTLGRYSYSITQDPSNRKVIYLAPSSHVADPPTDSSFYHSGDLVTAAEPSLDFSKSGLKFDGWCTTFVRPNNPCSGDMFSPGETFHMGSNDIYLFPIWNKTVSTCPNPIAIGTLSDPNACVAIRSIYFPYGGATTTDPLISRDASDYPINSALGHSKSPLAQVGSEHGPLEITLNQNSKYVGFWWSAGSVGNSVTFYDENDSIIASLNADAIYGKLAHGNQLKSLGATTYNTDDYYGHPADPTNLASGEPFVYIHVIAQNDALIRKIKLEAPANGFEFDNMTVGALAPSTPDQLVLIANLLSDGSQNSYSVIYDGNSNVGGSVPVDSNFYASESSATVLGNSGSLTNGTYEFNGWCLSAVAVGTNCDGTLYKAGDFVSINTDTKLYAVWLPPAVYWQITYFGSDQDSGSVPVDPISYLDGTSVGFEGQGSLVKNEFNFAGWCTQALSPGDTCSGTTYTASNHEAIHGNLNLYAIWSVYPTCSPTITNISAGVFLAKFVNTSPCNWYTPSGLSQIEYLIVGGGGGGGGDAAGGGAGGEVKNGTYSVLTNDRFQITVGQGGSGGSNPGTGGSGTNSSIRFNENLNTALGGSGGGPCEFSPPSLFCQSNAGGSNASASGSGGHGALHLNGALPPSDGLDGIKSSVLGTDFTFGSGGGGGGGGGGPLCVKGDGGKDSGGQGGDCTSYPTIFAPTSGAINSGGGGGGGFSEGASGADGVIYLKYSPKYQIAYFGNHNNSGTVPIDSNLYVSGATFNALDNTGNLEKSNAIFGGWNSEESGLGTSYQANSNFTISSDLNLFAVWKLVGKVVASSGSNGSISHSGIENFIQGDGKSITYNFIPNSNYKVVSIYADGHPLTASTTPTLAEAISNGIVMSGVVGNHTLEVNFEVVQSGGSGGGGTGGGGGYVPPIIITETPKNETPPIVTTEPTTPKSGTTTTKPKGRVTVSKSPTKTVITVKPAITTPAPAPTITNSPSDIQIRGLTNNQRVRVTLIDLNGKKKTLVATNDSQVSKLVNDNPSSKVSIEIVPTLNSALKKGAQIAIKGAKKFQRMRVTIK